MMIIERILGSDFRIGKFGKIIEDSFDLNFFKYSIIDFLDADMDPNKIIMGMAS